MNGNDVLCRDLEGWACRSQLPRVVKGSLGVKQRREPPHLSPSLYFLTQHQRLTLQFNKESQAIGTQSSYATAEDQ